MSGPAVLLPTQKPISLHNAFLVRQEIRYFDAVSNTWQPWLGSGVRVRFSLMPTGYDPNGYPSTLLGPYAMDMATAGVFFTKVTADALAPVLSPRVGQVIYQVVEGAYGSTYYDLTNVQPLLVIDPRTPK